MTNILNMILISPSALIDWHKKIIDTISGLRREGKVKDIDLSSIVDEQAESLPDGRLRIYASFNGHTVDIHLSPSQWRWLN